MDTSFPYCHSATKIRICLVIRRSNKCHIILPFIFSYMHLFRPWLQIANDLDIPTQEHSSLCPCSPHCDLPKVLIILEVPPTLDCKNGAKNHQPLFPLWLFSTLKKKEIKKKKTWDRTCISLSEAFLDQTSPIGVLLDWGFLAMTSDNLSAFQCLL